MSMASVSVFVRWNEGLGVGFASSFEKSVAFDLVPTLGILLMTFLGVSFGAGCRTRSDETHAGIHVVSGLFFYGVGHSLVGRGSGSSS